MTARSTADVHYCAAHECHPTRAKFTAFDPFWEFVAGPLNAGSFGPNALDSTFGPEVKFLGIPADMKPNRPPSDGFQFFGTLQANARTHSLTVKLHDPSPERSCIASSCPAGVRAHTAYRRSAQRRLV